jgi:acyl dehydratase
VTGAPALYFEDVTVGDVQETPAMTVTEAHASLYRGLSGDAAATPGAAPELLALCLATGLGWRISRPPLVVLAFMSVDWEITRPLVVGDTIHGRSRALAKRALRDGGVLVEEHEIVDQRGEVVQRGRFSFLVAKRPTAGAA